MSLKQKTISGLKWSFADNIINQGIQFIVGIILARLLSPVEFGLIGMVTFFLVISQTFIDSGFSQALIRKTDCSQEDYSTVFYFNIILGVLCYALLFLCSNVIGSFYNEPALSMIVKIIGINLIVNSFTIVPKAIITSKIDFKLQANISFISSVLSGIISIWMALFGWGVWSLVWRTISQNIITALILYIKMQWRPIFVFKMDSFNKLFSFGSKLLISGIIYSTFSNIYLLVIGKYYSAADLGYYTRADQFKNFPSQNITSVIQRVSYPVLVTVKDDAVKLKRGYQKLIKNIMFLSIVLMFGMAVLARPLVTTLIGEKWLPVVPYLQFLCLPGMMYPLHALNLNILKVKGRSDLFLWIELLKALLAIPTIIIGIFWGIKMMILGIFVNSIIAFIINSYWSSKLINYSIIEQLMDIIPSLAIALIMSIGLLFVGFCFHTVSLLILLFQILIGGMIVIILSHFIKYKPYIEMYEIIKSTIKNDKINLYLNEEK